MFFEDAMDDGEAKAGATLFGGEKRIQDTVELVLGDAAAGVTDGDRGIAPAALTGHVTSPILLGERRRCA